MLSTDQHEIRATRIGGSEIAAVAGLNPWTRPIDIYRRKTEPRAEITGPHIERGVHLEPALIAWYAARTGRAVKPSPTLLHPTRPAICATPDAITALGDERRTLEVKAPNWRTASDWGPSGTDEVPEYYVPQLMFEAACAETGIADAAAMIDGDLRIYSVAYDESLFGALADIARKFLHDHVEPRIPPPVDGSASYSEYLAERFPASRGFYRPAGAREEELAESLREIRAELDALKTRKAEVENHLKAFIADADGMTMLSERITWKLAKGATKTDWKALASELAPPPALIAKHTNISPGSRRFVVPRAWSKEEE